jgi:microcompartment protein CcmL/EutN
MDSRLQSVGMIEFNSIAAGIEAADYMVKAASVEILMLKTICPGKFVAAVHGSVASVEASVKAGLNSGASSLVDHFVIPNISPEVISAMNTGIEAPQGAAAGVIETFSAASSIFAADTAFKAAEVCLADVRIAMGLGGKAYTLITGDVGAVKAAVEAGAGAAAQNGLLVRKVIIPGMDPEVLKHIL